MKKIAILGAGTVGGSCAQILLRDAAVLEKNAGEALELAYVVDLRDMPDAPFHDKMVKDFAVVEADPEVFLVIEAIGGGAIVHASNERDGIKISSNAAYTTILAVRRVV